jgi:hypothetical protein
MGLFKQQLIDKSRFVALQSWPVTGSHGLPGRENGRPVLRDRIEIEGCIVAQSATVAVKANLRSGEPGAM